MGVNSRWRKRVPIGLTLTFALVVLSMVSASAAVLTVQISTDPYFNSTSNHKTQVEPDTFSFGNTIVATFQSGRFFDGGASNIGVATSTNAGKTWTHSFLPSSTVYATPPGKYPRASDPSVAYDAKHGVWVISWLGIKSPTGPVDVLVSRSTNGGLTWGAPVVVNASGHFNDKNWTVCDDTATSPFFGHCYTEFDDATGLNILRVSTSTDGGLTWGAARSNPQQTCVIGGQPVVQPNGTVIVPIDDCFEANILSIRSTDGGNTWSQPFLAAQIFNDGQPGGIRAPDLPTAEIDKTGRVYVVWADCRFAAGCATGNNNLLLTTSDDGMNWSLPRLIPTAGMDQLIPGLAVDRSTASSSAHLGLTYHYFPTTPCSPQTCQLNVGFVSSANGGASWSASQQLAGPMTLTWLPLTTQGFMVGDYISTSLTPGDDSAVPVFAVAKAPTPPPNCSNLSTGAPGQGCNEAMFTIAEDELKIVGGTNPSTDVVTSQPLPVKSSRLTAPATAY